METFKNTTEQQLDVPLLDLHVGPGQTFEVPDEFAHQFDANPAFSSSRVKNPDVVPDPNVVAAVTGPVPVVGAPGQVPDAGNL